MPGYYHYRAYGLTFRSTEVLEGWPADKPAQHAITIKRSLEQMDNASLQRMQFLRHHDSIRLLCPPDVSFDISPTSIHIHAPSQQDNSRLGKILTGSCMAALLQLRQLPVFHGSAATNGRQTLLLLGSSGAGKSTTVAALQQKGWQIQTDDIAALASKNGDDHILPGLPRIKLNTESLDALSLKADSGTLIDAQRQKFAVPFHPSETCSPLTAIIFLSFGDHLQLLPLNYHQSLQLLLRHVYRPVFLEWPGDGQRYLNTATRLCKQLPCIVFQRPRNSRDIKASIDALEQAMTPDFISSAQGNAPS